MEKETIHIPLIELGRSDWAPWDSLKVDSRSGQGVIVPNRVPGVYEARLIGAQERLTIGKTSNLRYRIKQGLVKGIAQHSAGDDIRANAPRPLVLPRAPMQPGGRTLFPTPFLFFSSSVKSKARSI